jgi:hypothetical protein
MYIIVEKAPDGMFLLFLFHNANMQVTVPAPAPSYRALQQIHQKTLAENLRVMQLFYVCEIPAHL